MKITVFYSWQSDLPNDTNRRFIATALEKAIREVDSSLEIAKDDRPDDPNIGMDQDTQGVPGTHDIVHTIFDKIQNASIFIGDISIINKGLASPTSQTNTYRLTPNPNVLIELGYAANYLGWDKIICVFNAAFGDVRELPFDLHTRRILPYEKTEAKAESTNHHGHLSSQLQVALQAIVNTIQEEGDKNAVSLGPLLEELEYNLENNPDNLGDLPGGKFRTSVYGETVHRESYSALPSELKGKLRTSYRGCEEANDFITSVQNQQTGTMPWAVTLKKSHDARRRVRPLIEDALSALRTHLESSKQ